MVSRREVQPPACQLLRAFLCACWGVCRSPTDVYRLRFGVETSYRQMNQIQIRTSTQNPALRLLFVAVALLLRNLWAWLHWVVLAESRRGVRVVRLERLRLRVLANWLLHLAEEVQIGGASAAASKPPAPGSKAPAATPKAPAATQKAPAATPKK